MRLQHDLSGGDQLVVDRHVPACVEHEQMPVDGPRAFAARHHCGLGVSYGSFEGMAQSTKYYRDACAEFGWTPSTDHVVYRANMILAETDDAAETALKNRDKQAPAHKLTVQARTPNVNVGVGSQSYCESP